MSRFATRLLLASFAFIALCGTAAEAKVPSINCKSKPGELQAAINKAEFLNVTTVIVSGTCIENLTIPRGKTFVLIGTLGSTKIVAKDASLPVVSSHGDTTIQNITLQNATGAADSLVQAERGGVLQLIGVDLSAPKVASVISIWDNANGSIVNSRIGGGAGVGADIANGGSLWLGADPAQISGPDGAKTTVTGGLSCGPGSRLLLRVKSAKGKDGVMSITTGPNSLAAIGANQCDVNIQNRTPSASNLAISSSNGPGVSLNNSTLQLEAATLANNKEAGLDAIASSAMISGSNFTDNSGGDLKAGPGSSLILPGWSAKNNIPSAFSSNTLQCWPEKSSGQIFVGKGGIVIPAGKTFMNLLESNDPCVNPM